MKDWFTVSGKFLKGRSSNFKMDNYPIPIAFKVESLMMRMIGARPGCAVSYKSDCRSKGCEFVPGSVPYFRED